MTLIVAMLASALGVAYVSTFDQAWWKSLERTAERNALRRGVPQGSETNESDDIRERAELTFNRLAYPARSIPSNWAGRAAQHVSQNVRDGSDMYGPRSTSSKTSLALIDAAQPISTISWTPMGPAPIDNNTATGGYKYGLVTGRINALAVHPTNSAIAYAGATAGGLWKTTNCCSASTSWTALWNDKIAVSQAVGAIEFDPNDATGNTLYIGTGDFDAADQYSAGIMKTTDGGTTWTQLGATVFTPYAAGTPDKPEQNIGSIEVDPHNANTIAVGTRHGFFMSYDAGVSWARYNVHGLATESQRVSSIILDGSTTPTTMYVAVGYPYSSRLYGNIGGGNGIYKASMPSSGAPVFTKQTSGFPQNTVGGTTNTVGRIELAVSKQNPQKMYAQVSNYDINVTNALGTYVTTNGGSTWTLLSGSADTNYRNCSNQATGEGQDWYDLFIGVDPSNDTVLYIGRTSLYKMTVSGTAATISDLANVYSLGATGTACTSSYGKLHPDQHAVAMISSTSFLVGNDGGVYLANGSLGGFTPMQNGLNISQFYAGQIGANFASSSTQYAFGGLQDNGSASWDAANTSAQWQARGNGGDGFFTAFDPIAGSKTAGNWYTEYTYGDLDCSTTGAQGAFNSCAGAWYNTIGAQVDRSDWSTPFTLDQLHCTTASCRNIILGTYRMWASGTGGTTRSAWTAVSADLTKGNITTDTAANTIIDVRFAPSSPTTALVGTDDGNVQWSSNLYTGTACTQAAANTSTFACTPNASATWVNLTGANAVLPNRAIQGVAFDPANSQVVYAAVGGFNQNTASTPGHLFRASCSASCTTAANWSWVNKTGNLPDVPASSVIVNPNNPLQVFVGTHFGFYYTNDISAASVNWQQYQNNLPNTVIQYLTVDRGATTLAAFTYGRGLYTIQLPGAGGFDANAPSGLAASAASSSQINLSWADNSSDETGFKIERCAGASCTNFALLTTTGAGATSFSDTGLTASTSYSYRVKAVRSSGDTAASNTASATTFSNAAPPAAPSSLAASAASSSQVNLSWADNSTDETGFQIERCAGASCTSFALLTTTAAGATSFSDTGLTASTSYSYRVRAINGGGSSAYSNTASATTQAATAGTPAAPTNLVGTAFSKNRIDLSWTDNATNETGFTVERCTGSSCTNFVSIGTVGANVAAVSNSGLTTKTTYRYRVKATNAAGSSAYSNIVTVTTK